MPTSAYLNFSTSTATCVADHISFDNCLRRVLKTLRMARADYEKAIWVMGFIFGSCDLPVQQCQALREQQVCILGWALLFLWLGTILYMTREMWCVKLNTNGSSTTSLIPSSPKTSTVIEIE